MKNYFMNLFDLEEGEFEVKDIAAAGISLAIVVGFVFSPVFM